MSDEEDSDWYDILFHPTQYRSWHRIFDYILHFLKSAEWDAAVMGFIDNNCAVFVNDDENKFEYSQIHRAFVDEIEALIDAQLDKVGISNDLLVAACKHALATITAISRPRGDRPYYVHADTATTSRVEC